MATKVLNKKNLRGRTPKIFTDEEPLLVTGYNVTLGFGSVYILRRDTFRQHGDEFISYSPVPILEEVFVGPATLLHIRHDYDLRIPVPHPWR